MGQAAGSSVGERSVRGAHEAHARARLERGAVQAAVHHQLKDDCTSAVYARAARAGAGGCGSYLW